MSSVTGNGITEFFEAVDASREEYERYANTEYGSNAFSYATGNTFQSSSAHGRLGINPYKT